MDEILLIVLIVVAVLVVAVGYFVVRIFMSLVRNRISIVNIQEVDVQSNEKTLSLIIGNKGMTDIALKGMGFRYENKSFDFVDNYKKQNQIVNKSIILPPRSSIKLTLTFEELEGPVFKTMEKEKFGRIKAFVLNTAGTLIIKNANNIGKVLKSDHEKRRLNASVGSISTPKSPFAPVKKEESAKFGEELKPAEAAAPKEDAAPKTDTAPKSSADKTDKPKN